MAAATIPFSNPAGKNQTNPSPIAAGSTTRMPSGAIPGSPQIPGTPVSTTNPYVPPPTATPGAGGGLTPFNPGGGPASSASNGFITSGTDAGQNALQKQLTDIYGQGTGASLFSLLNNMSGTDSTILQEYIKSLQPQMSTAQANTNAALGAGGVSANSSVAAIADSNLQSQEFASIASESANLTQSQEQLTSQILQGTEGASAKEVATSDWSVLGDVLNNVTGDIGNVLSIGGLSIPGSKGSSNGSVSGAVLQNAQNNGGAGIDATDPSLYNPQPIPFS